MQEMRVEIAAQFAERPWYTSGSTLVLSRLTAPRAVLLGDAAHAVSAAFGQGVNSALEARAHLPHARNIVSKQLVRVVMVGDQVSKVRAKGPSAS